MRLWGKETLLGKQGASEQNQLMKTSKEKLNTTHTGQKTIKIKQETNT